MNLSDDDKALICRAILQCEHMARQTKAFPEAEGWSSLLVRCLTAFAEEYVARQEIASLNESEEIPPPFLV